MKELLRHLKPYTKECIIAPLFKMIEATFELLVPLVVAYIINHGIKNQDYTSIGICIGLLLAFAIVGFICALIAQYFSAKAAIGFAKEVKQTLYEHIQTLSFADIDKIGISSLITNMSSDITQMQTGVNIFLRLFLRSPFVVLGAVIMSFTVNVKTAFVFAIAVPILSIFVFLVMYKSIPLMKKVQLKLSNLLKRTRNNLSGIRVIRAFKLEHKEAEEFMKANNDFSKFQLFAGKISSLLNPITYIIINFAIIAIIYLGGFEVNNGIIENGDVVAQYNYMSQILVELIKFASFTITINKALASGKRVFSVLEVKNTQYFPETSNIENDSDIAIEMTNCALRYPKNQENSIEGINLTIKKGETVGIIGATGSGKTTLVSLLARYYDATEGSIKLFGNDINQYSKKDLRETVGIVLQNSVLFKGTIKDNLLMANNKSDEEILKALEISQALEVVKNRENQLNAEVFQGGSNFSGGQKQRLSIARTLLSDPKILILDDSSSALDFLTDKNLRDAIKKINNDLALLIISSRCASIINADKIVVLDEGKIVGLNTHENLLKTCQIYQEIYYSQTEKEGI